MARVPVHDVESAPEGSRDDLKQLEQRFGQVLNIFGAMAHSPTVIQLFTDAEQAIASTTSLEPTTREAIHLAVAEVNDCDYCRSAYTMAAKGVGFDEDETVAIRDGEIDFDDDLSALLDVAREVAANKGHVADDTWQAALDGGWSEEQLLEAFADTIRTILTNYFNHVAGTDIDIPKAPRVA